MITVIGGGPAGRLASMRLALGGKDVTLIEKDDELGGQCLHKGCMVTCALNDVARAVNDCENFKDLGIFDDLPVPCYSRIIEGMKDTQGKIANVLERETKASGVEIIYGQASVSGREVIVNSERLKPDNIIISTGSIPRVPDIEGVDLKGVYNPHTLADLRQLPEKISIIGGGVIAAEYAYIFSSLGVETEIIARSSLLRGKPGPLIDSAKRELKKVKLRENCIVTRIDGDKSVSNLEVIEKGEKASIKTDAVIVAAGLVPNSSIASGLKKDKDGAIVVDKRMESSLTGVYAAGDVIGPPYFTPVARLQGIIAAESILGERERIIPTYIPQSVKLQYEHSFCEIVDKEIKDFSLPSPAGPGSFWYVHQGYTGKSVISTDPEINNISGIYLGAPGSGPVCAYMASLLEKGISISDFSNFLEVHPSTDGIPSLMKYLSRLKENPY